jgi:galactoside O-acetyltransferase
MKKGNDVIIHETAVIKYPDLIEIGNSVAIDPFFYITTGAKLNNFIHIGSHVSVIGGNESVLIVDDYTAISTGCRLVCKSDDFRKKGIAIPFAKNVPRYIYGGVIQIEKKVILGANVVVLPNVIIHEGAVVGANSLVKEDLDPWGIYVGSPTRKIGERYD